MSLGQVVGGIGHGLDIAALFFYKALWSILFGVAVTAAVDVFVDKDKNGPPAGPVGRQDGRVGDGGRRRGGCRLPGCVDPVRGWSGWRTWGAGIHRAARRRRARRLIGT